jgi:DNA helicase-2/ATP-dependent DNA helicase PcrA
MFNEMFKMGINSGTQGKINDFITLIKSFQAMVPSHNAYEVGNHISVHSGILRDLYADKTPEGVSRYENIQELLNGLKEFTENNSALLVSPDAQTVPEGQPRTLAEFMQDIALLTDADKEEAEEDKNKVSLMTIHSAKGLEFPYVFIVGLEENLFPSQLSLNSRTDLEEERRLFYVAITRAEKNLTLSFATTRYRWGNLVMSEPSRFLDEIGKEFLDVSAALALPAKETYSSRLNSFKPKEKGTDTIAPAAQPVRKNFVKVQQAGAGDYNNEHLKNLQPGMTVEHERFGQGKVLQMEGVFPNSKATVFFQGVGQKQLLLKFARLKILS